MGYEGILQTMLFGARGLKAVASTLCQHRTPAVRLSGVLGVCPWVPGDTAKRA